jgi:uncharacterized membrane protein (DUF373 family)
MMNITDKEKFDMIHNVAKSIERFIITSLVVMMSLVLIFATIDLGWILVRDLIFHEPMFLLSVDDLLDLFGLFLLVLIGLELLDTVIRTYMMKKTVHVEIVIAVAIIAVARKVIILDVKEMSPLLLVGIAALTFSLCAGFFLLRKARMGRTAGKDQGSAPGQPEVIE